MKYILTVQCYRGGLWRDSGKYDWECADDATAKLKAQTEVSALFKWYDLVEWQFVNVLPDGTTKTV